MCVRAQPWACDLLRRSNFEFSHDSDSSRSWVSKLNSKLQRQGKVVRTTQYLMFNKLVLSLIASPSQSHGSCWVSTTWSGNNQPSRLCSHHKMADDGLFQNIAICNTTIYDFPTSYGIVKYTTNKSGYLYIGSQRSPFHASLQHQHKLFGH